MSIRAAALLAPYTGELRETTSPVTELMNSRPPRSRVKAGADERHRPEDVYVEDLSHQRIARLQNRSGRRQAGIADEHLDVGTHVGCGVDIGSLRHVELNRHQPGAVPRYRAVERRHVTCAGVYLPGVSLHQRVHERRADPAVRTRHEGDSS
jgi:hypothetical protein